MDDETPDDVVSDTDDLAPDANEPGDDLPKELADKIVKDEREIIPDEVDGEG